MGNTQAEIIFGNSGFFFGFAASQKKDLFLLRNLVNIFRNITLR